jgi:hypothetical protein
VADLYEAAPEFRDFVKRKIRDGVLTSGRAAEVFLTRPVTDYEEDAKSSDVDLAKAAQALKEEFYSQP